MAQMFIPLAWPNGSRYNETNMKNYFRTWIGIVCSLGVLGSNALAQDQSGKNNIFGPIKAQMLSVAEKNAVLAKQNQTLRVRLIGLQLEVERHEKVIRDLDPGFINKERRSREEDRASSVELMSGEELENSALIKEAQDLFLSGQYMDLDEEQRLWELQLYDLQYQKQELEIDLQDRQALRQKIEGQRRRELQIVEGEVQESAREEKNIHRKVAEAKKKVMAYPQNIDLLKMENETLRKRIGRLRSLLSR